VNPSIYPALSASIERAVQATLKEVPNGSAGEVTASLKKNLDLEIRELDEPRKNAVVEALASFGSFSNQQLAGCFPALAQLADLRWGARSPVNAPPEACLGLFDTATYRALSEFLDKVMRLTLQDVSNNSSASDLMKAFQSHLQSVEKSESPPVQIAIAMSTLFNRLDDAAACVPVLAPFQERMEKEAAASHGAQQVPASNDWQRSPQPGPQAIVPVPPGSCNLDRDPRAPEIPLSRSTRKPNLSAPDVQNSVQETVEILQKEVDGQPHVNSWDSQLSALVWRFRALFQQQMRHYAPTQDLKVAFSWIESWPAEQLMACLPQITPVVLLAAKQWQDAENEVQRKAEEAAQEAGKPINLLRSAYEQYIFIKKCYDIRQGYLTVNISDPELARAREAVKRIEEKLRPELPSGTTTDELWSKANVSPISYPVVQSACQMVLRSLEQTHGKLVPEDTGVKKDF
jgi:hypothetical protein